jgi:hypothetical protein
MQVRTRDACRVLVIDKVVTRLVKSCRAAFRSAGHERDQTHCEQMLLPNLWSGSHGWP